MKVQIYLGGKPGTLSGRSLSKALVHMIKLIDELSEPGEHAVLPVEELRTGSASATLDTPPVAGNRLKSGLTVLRRDGVMPDGWTPTALDEIESLIRIGQDDGVTKVELNPDDELILLDIELGEAIEKARRSDPVSMASVSGRLYSYSHPEGKLASARISISDGRGPVRVTVPDTLIDKVKAALDTEVEAWGIVTRSRKNDAVHTMKLMGLEPITNIVNLHPPARSLRGLWANDAGSDDSVAIVRKMRDEQ